MIGQPHILIVKPEHCLRRWNR